MPQVSLRTKRFPKTVVFLEKTMQVYSRLDTIIGFLEPFSLRGNDILRKNVKLDEILTKTMMSYISWVFNRVEKKISKMVRLRFGVIFSGWTCI